MELSPKEPQEKPQGAPAGVRKLPDRLDRPSPYGVFWKAEGKAKKMFFATVKDRDTKFTELQRSAKRGNLGLEPSRDDLRDWAAFRHLIGSTPWREVVAGWQAHRTAGGGTSSRLVADAVAVYLADLKARESKGTVSKGTLSHKQTMLGRFGASFGARKMTEVSPSDFGSWVEDDLGFDEPGTFNSYRRCVVALYNYFIEELGRNPMEKIHIQDDTVVVGINTVQEISKLFAYAQAHCKDAIGRLALEAFAGIRFSSAYKLDKSEINFQDRGLLLPAAKLKKTGGKSKMRYVDGFPETLWAWLALATPGCWAMTNNDWMHMKSQLFRDAKVFHPHNSLRHSFCTHHVAAFKNPGLTAALLCHRNQEKLWSNYNGIATQAAGKEWWRVLPDTAATMAVDDRVEALVYPQLPVRPTESQHPGD